MRDCILPKRPYIDLESIIGANVSANRPYWVGCMTDSEREIRLGTHGLHLHSLDNQCIDP